MKTSTMLVLLGVLFFLCPFPSSAIADTENISNLEKLNKLHISVFELFLDEIKTLGQETLSNIDTPPRHMLESVAYDADKQMVIMFFTLAPENQFAKAFIEKNPAEKQQLFRKEIESLAIAAGCRSLDGMDKPLGLIQLVPFRGVIEKNPGFIDQLKDEIVRRTTILLQLNVENKIYIGSLEPNGEFLFTEVR